ncbi:uncharacterized protein C2845_PM06G28390 [Panicum miliaceum]|uniref:DUF4408 domain-containing protein n=1 Tax=Panicum miliaceum TaxID=4540 RepID=A0A3L6RAX1_PANMI|nr:uncharacterized protein C2845_PM06G28390 [Panicum miliaceum]
MDVRSCMKATLLAILILSVVTWLSHLYSCIKNFMESLPSVVSAIIAPKCLFIFSNIIVVYLVSESKLSRRRSKLMKTGNEAAARDEDMLQDSRKQHADHGLTEVLLLTILGESKHEQENKMAMEEEEEGGDLELELGEEMSGDVQRERAVDEESEEWDLPRVDELNRRVEDFIARFNMERQLEEARMPVCCY